MLEVSRWKLCSSFLRSLVRNRPCDDFLRRAFCGGLLPEPYLRFAIEVYVVYVPIGRKGRILPSSDGYIKAKS